MIYHDITFEDLASAPIKQTNVIVAQQSGDIYGYMDNGLTFTSSDSLESVAIDSVGSFLGATTKKATVKLLGIVNDVLAGDIYQVRLGLWHADSSVPGWDYLSEGFFIVDNVAYDYDAGDTTVTLYDHMWTASDTDYVVGQFAYPLTVQELATTVANLLGADLMSGFSSLPNASYVIEADLYADISGTTLMNVIQEIAASTGTMARMSDYALTFAPFVVSDEVLTSNELKSLTIGSQYGPVSSVVLGRVPQNDNIALQNGTPATSTISSIDTTTNLITVTSNDMTDGTLVQVTSTGTMPAPLVENTNYFVFTNGNANTFALSDTYSHALAGTNLIDLTTAGTGSITLSPITLQEVQINNVQILDNDRADLLPPLYAALLGETWSASDAKTIGLGWHEVGDVIQYQQGSTTVNSLLYEVHLTLAGSIQEELISNIPTATSIDYQTAGGVLKTLYDTEIKTDKQQNTITSIVDEQTTFENQTTDNFSQVFQDIDGITTSIQESGGGNLLLNSVGYAKDQSGTLSFWTQSGTGLVTSYSSADSLGSGGISGNVIDLSGASVQITQRINVSEASKYSVGFRVNKGAGNGGMELRLTNGTDDFVIAVANATAYSWQELKLEGITPSATYWDVTLIITTSATKIEVTDLRVMYGTTLPQWEQSQSEILNAQVALTTEGIKVSSSVFAGDYTVMTPLEFSGYSSASPTPTVPVFTVNRDTTEVTNLSISTQTEFGNVIRAIPITSGSHAGLAFVGAVS